MNVTIDREEGIRLLHLILGGKEETQQAGWARNSLRITSGGYFEGTNALYVDKDDISTSVSKRAAGEKLHSSGDGWLADDAGIASLARDDLVVNPSIRLFEAAAKRRIRLPF
jgi:hypothetical protein